MLDVPRQPRIDVRPLPGTYALLLASAESVSLQVGKLGRLLARPGFYVYVGSAFGPGGLRARLTHHGRVGRRPRWHVDHLRALTRLCEIWFTYDGVRREHQWAAALSEAPDARLPLGGFGSSDCDCPTHLFFFGRRPSASSFARNVSARFPNHAPIHVATLGREYPMPGPQS